MSQFYTQTSSIYTFTASPHSQHLRIHHTHIFLGTEQFDKSRMDATSIQRIFRGYLCRRKHMGQQLCDRISEMAIELDEQKYYDSNVISQIHDDLAFVQQEIKSHGPFVTSIPTGMPGLRFLQELSPYLRFCTFSEILDWITEAFIPAYKERAEKRVENQNLQIQCYESKEGPLLPAAPGLDKYSLSDYYYDKMLEARGLLKPCVVPDLEELCAIGLDGE